jgi:predicted negative regulator of RcsB-dependent stress response
MAKRRPVSRSRPSPSASGGDDIFVEKTLVVSNWARQNRQALTLGAIGLAALLGGALYYASYRSGHLNEAAIELERVRQNAMFGDTAAATVELRQYVESFGNTPYAAEASLLLGELYLNTGQPAEAVAALAATADPSDPIGVQAAVLLARAHEQAGQLDEAERVYLEVADDADLDFQIFEALADAARIRQSRGDAAGAAALYQRILDDIDETAPLRDVYRMRLEEARARAPS